LKAIPVSDIYEITVAPGGMMSVVYNSAPPVMTDSRGRFSFEALDSSAYKLTFVGRSYSKQEITLAAGQPKTDIVIRMKAVAAISGRIRDSAGQPVAGVPVELFRPIYDQAGQKKNQRVAVTRTNDFGEYRMYYIVPGRYYLSAGGPAGEPDPRLQRPDLGDQTYTTPNSVSQYFSPTYYPGTAEAESATALDVQSGADLRGIDLLVNPQRPYRIRGRVVNPRPETPFQDLILSLNPQGADNSGKTTISFFASTNLNYNAADGSFDLRDVNPGAYFITATGVVPPPPGGRPADVATMSFEEQVEFQRSRELRELTRPQVSLPIRVNADLEGLVLVIEDTGFLTGRLRVEPGAATNPAVSLNSVRVQLKHTAILDRLGSGLQVRATAADGTFRVDNMRPGEYRLSIAGLPEGLYVKEARLGQIDVLAGPFRYSVGDTTPLDVVLSPNVGAITGTVQDASGRPFPEAKVVLIPNRTRERPELFKAVVADGKGRFAIPSITPGEYTLAAWQTLEPYAFFDPAVIRQAETQGKTLRIEEASSLAVAVTGIH
jgi:protocatechuate 3,4-dioxygenase beta subunit